MAFELNIKNEDGSAFKNISQLEAMLAAIPTTMTEVCVTEIYNSIDSMTGNREISLDSDGNRVSLQGQLANVFARLPTHVTHVNFSKQHLFAALSQENFQRALEKLPSHVTKLTFELTDIASMKYKSSVNTLPYITDPIHKSFKASIEDIRKIGSVLAYVHTVNLIYDTGNYQLTLNKDEIESLKKAFCETIGRFYWGVKVAEESLYSNNLPKPLADLISVYAAGKEYEVLKKANFFSKSVVESIKESKPKAETNLEDDYSDDICRFM